MSVHWTVNTLLIRYQIKNCPLLDKLLNYSVFQALFAVIESSFNIENTGTGAHVLIYVPIPISAIGKY